MSKYSSMLFLVCSILTMVVIFIFSSQEFKETMNTSGVIVKPIENTVKTTKDVSFSDKKTEEKYWKQIESKLTKIVRKLAHMFIFGVLAFFVYMFLKSIGVKDADAIIFTLLICFIYGCTDEFHQRFVHGRTSQFFDVCVDTCGSYFAILMVYVVGKIKKYIKSHK